MIYHKALLLTCWTLAYGQPPPVSPETDAGVLTDQARQFIDRMSSFNFFFNEF